MFKLSTTAQKVGFVIIWLLLVGGTLPRLESVGAVVGAAVVGAFVAYTVVRAAASFRAGMKEDQSA